MSTPDGPSNPPLTRRQLRELRDTASNPVITPEEARDAAAASAESDAAAAVEAPEATIDEGHDVDVAHELGGERLSHSQDDSVSQAPEVLLDADIDLDSTPVTRRQARHLAKLRTASIGVIPAGDAAAARDDAAEGDAVDPDPVEAAVVEPEPETAEGEILTESEAADTPDESAESEPEYVQIDENDDVVTPAGATDEISDEPHHDEDAASADAAGTDDESESDDADHEPDLTDAPGGLDRELEEPEAERDVENAPVVSSELGAQLLTAEPGQIELPPSFDQLLTRGGGSSSAPNALILSQTPDTGSLSVPIMGTGELLITGSYALPDNYGSTGTVPGAQDGKDLDAALIDGELPAASSPTPIAASAAISTIKSADEIIRPPAPERGSRLMMTLAITAGALGLALATVLILAVVNGVF
ncbi:MULTISPECIES: hypothetical protein [unclassified Microbacterium]|uniref:hypothetical protein n=1 Tax=unclassified Microbacterium TaxID=2609290 RepID=UPI00386B5137